MDCRFLISRTLSGQIEYQPNKKIDRIGHGQSVHCTNYPRSYQKILNHLGLWLFYASLFLERI